MTHATIARGLATVALVFLATWMFHETPASRMTAAEQNRVRGGDWTEPGECRSETEYGAECFKDPALGACARGNAYCMEQFDEVLCVDEIEWRNPSRCKESEYVTTRCKHDEHARVACWSRRQAEMRCKCTLSYDPLAWICVSQFPDAPTYWSYVHQVPKCEME